MQYACGVLGSERKSDRRWHQVEPLGWPERGPKFIITTWVFYVIIQNSWFD